MLKNILLIFVVLAICVIPIFAQFEEDDASYGAVLTPEVIWRIAESSWNNRNYDDAAVIMENLATEFPDFPYAVDCWWRAYETYKYHRPNTDKMQNVLHKGNELCLQWEEKYKNEDINRVARAIWYRANYLDREGNKPAAVMLLQTIHRQYPGSSYDHEGTWHAAEWARQLRDYATAIICYQMHQEVHVNNNDWKALDYIRMGLCYLELQNVESAKESYLAPLFFENLNWGWDQIYWGMLEGARRLKAEGETQAANQILTRIIDKCNPDWDVTKQAQTELGEDGMSIDIYPHINRNYITDSISVDARSNVNLTYDYSLLIRPKYLQGNDTFKANVEFEVKHPVTSQPNDMTASGSGYTVTLPGHAGDFWYRLSAEEHERVPLPDSIVISRSWEKASEDWGYATIRVQSRARYNIYIYLPNSNTNPNNLNIQPNEVRDNGTCFRWYDWYDLNGGMSIKIPIEIGKNINKYYPKVMLQRNIHGQIYQNIAGKDKIANADNKDLKITVTYTDSFPFVISFPGDNYITLREIKE